MKAAPLISGLMYALIVMTVCTFILSLILLGTEMPESSWTLYTFIIHGASMLAGGMISGKRSGQKGLYNGLFLGLLYTITIWIIGLLAYDAGLTQETLYLLAVSLATGAFGGITGVNMSSKKHA